MLLLAAGIVLLAALGSAAEQETPLLPALVNRTTLHSRYDTERGISENQISALLRAGFTMPTGGGQRSLDFFVVTNRETMHAMQGGNPYSQALNTATCVIVIAADNGRAYYGELQEMDAGLAAGAVLAEAAELGLTTCVLSIAPQQERMTSVRAALQMPGSYTPVLMIAVGYPAEDALSSASVDGWNEGQVHYNVYQGK